MSPSHMALQQFMARPDREDGQREELIEGELIVSPASKPWHADIVRRLHDGLSPLKHLGFVLVNDFACILGKLSMPAPDLAAVQSARWDKAVKSGGWLEDSPELVIEVASPSNRALHRKAAVYLQHGAEQVWIVYPKTRTVKVATPNSTTELHLAETLTFQGVTVPIASLFP